jgi:hypothetical protein
MEFGKKAGVWCRFVVGHAMYSQDDGCKLLLSWEKRHCSLEIVVTRNLEIKSSSSSWSDFARTKDFQATIQKRRILPLKFFIATFSQDPLPMEI